MRVKSSTIGAVALAFSLAAGMAPTAMAKDKADAKAPAKATNSPEFVKVAGPVQKAVAEFQAMKGKNTDAEIKAAATALGPQIAGAEAAAKTPLDRLIVGQWQQIVGGAAGDYGLMQKGLQNMLDSGQLPADKTALVGFALGQVAYQNKDYAAAAKALGPVVAANYSENAAAELLADAYAKQGQPAQGLAALKTAVDARKAAGGAIPESWFTRANTIAYNAKLANEGTDWALMMVNANPTPTNFFGAAQLVRLYGNYATKEGVDISRLMFRSGALGGKGKDVEREYVEYLQAADPRTLPGEVVKVGEAGIAAGALRANDTFVADSLAQARGRVAADKASLAGAAKAAAASPTGVTAMSTADAYLSYGQDAQAEEMYKLAIQKGGIDKDRATLRLGIALLDSGKTAEAKATFGQVTGKEAAIARLWSAYADAKAAGKVS